MKAKMIGSKKAGMMMATLTLTVGLFFGAKVTTFAANEAEENENIKAAQESVELTFGETKHEVFNENRDTDYYKLTVTGGGYITLNVSCDSTEHYRVDVSLINSQNNVLYSRFIYKDMNSITSTKCPVDAGTYYVRISSVDNEGKGYTVQTDYTAADNWEHEVNDDKAHANIIPLNKEMYGSTLYYETAMPDNDDWYRFDILQSGTVSIELNQLNDSANYDNLAIWLEDSEQLLCDEYGNPIFFEYASNDNHNLRSNAIELDPGTYYLNIVGNYESGLEYSVKVNYDSPTAQLSAFVTRMYEVVLGRTPDAAGLNDWVGRLNSGEANAVDIVFGFVNSDEYKNQGKSNGEIVNDCYHAMLGRDADEGGYNDWVGRLNNGMSVNAILAGFVGSEEFGNLCKTYGIQPGSYTCAEARDQNLGVTSYVARLYTQALGRNFDPNGLNDWCGRIIADPSRDNIIQVAANGFFHSQEFLNKNLNNEEYVKVLYRTFLGRECDPNGLADWVGQLDRGEKSRDEILPGFANSQEFSNIMAQYGL